FTVVVHRYDVAMIEPRDAARLALEAGDERRIRAQLGTEHLDRHAALQVVVPSAIHQRIAARAQQLADCVTILDHLALQVHGSSSASAPGAWSGPPRRPWIGLVFTAGPLHANSRGTTPASVSTQEVFSHAQDDRGAGTESARWFHLSFER